MAVILCPQDAVGETVKDIQGKQVNKDGPSGDTEEHSKSKGYLCAMVLPSILPEAYELSLWRQVVVNVEAMEAEVVLEYDIATRYYFIKV